MASQTLSLLLRGLQFFWALLVIALVGNMIHNATGGNPPIVNFDMFAAVFAMLTLLYLVPATLREELQFHPALAGALDALNTLFWFCAAVAMSRYLGVHSCANDDYTRSNFVTNGSVNTHKRCTEAQASTAFLWFGFFAFAASAVFSFLGSMHGGHTGGRGTPSMSQV